MRARRLRRLGQLTGGVEVVPAAESKEQPAQDISNSSSVTLNSMPPVVVPQLDSQKNKLIVGTTELSHDDDRISEMDDIHHKQKHQKFSNDHDQQLICAEKASNTIEIVGECLRLLFFKGRFYNKLFFQSPSDRVFLDVRVCCVNLNSTVFRQPNKVK